MKLLGHQLFWRFIMWAHQQQPRWSTTWTIAQWHFWNTRLCSWMHLRMHQKSEIAFENSRVGLVLFIWYGLSDHCIVRFYKRERLGIARFAPSIGKWCLALNPTTKGSWWHLWYAHPAGQWLALRIQSCQAREGIVRHANGNAEPFARRYIYISTCAATL